MRQHEAPLSLISMEYVQLSTSSSCWRAALALIFAAPRLLADTPPCHPISVSCNTVVGLRCCRTSNLARASFTMNFAAPRLLSHRPTHLPICVSIRTIVRVCGPGWGHRSNWHNWHWLRNNHWWCSGWATLVVNLAAPSLLASTPLLHGIHCAIVRIACWHRTCGTWPGHRPRLRPWWCWWRCWRWCRWCSWCCGRECRCCTAHTCRHAAVLHLFI